MHMAPLEDSVIRAYDGHFLDDTVFSWPVFAAGRIYTDTMMELLIAQVP